MKISGETALLLAVVYALLASAVGQQDGIVNNDAYIESIAELSNAIKAGPNRKVGAVSAVNFASVATLLPINTELVIYNTTEQIVDAITSGKIIAGMISGPTIDDPDRRLFSFASTIISPRAFMFRQGDSQSAIDMIDAAIVRMTAKGSDNALALANPPFDYLGIQTCKPDPTAFPFPSTVNATGVLADILTSGKLKMGYIPVDMIQDGDYTQIPPTRGFFPQYMDEIVRVINENMNTSIQIDRSPSYAAYSSGQLLGMVNAGIVHTLEPYFQIDANFQGRARKRAFALSCVVLGRSRDDSRFYTKRPVPDSGKKSALTPGQTAGVVIAVVVAVAGSLMIGLMVWHERKGKPLFAPLVTVPAHDDDMGAKEMKSPHAVAVTKDPDTHHL